MSSFTTGFFTLVAALGGSLGGIWLKDYLENKNESKKTVRQKAVEAYSIASNLPYSLNSYTVACSTLLADRSFDYTAFLSSNPSTSLNLLSKLELLIIECFYEIKPEFLEVETTVVSRASYLLKLMYDIKNSNSNLTYQEFEGNEQEFNTKIIKVVSELKDKLDKKFINPPEPQ